MNRGRAMGAETRPRKRNDAYSGFHRFPGSGSFEVIYFDRADCSDIARDNPGEERMRAGWYWRACFPGCLPDSEPCGPFTSSRAAWQDARDI